MLSTSIVVRPMGVPTNQIRPVPRKVLLPVIAARIEQARERAGHGVDAGNVGPFVGIVVLAGKGEVCGGGRTVVFGGDDVVELEGQDIQSLGQPAVLAGVSRALPDQLPEGVVHGIRRVGEGPGAPWPASD